MTTSYNYTGYYAIQVNFQNSSAASAFGTHEYSNIPGNSMSAPSGFSISLQIADQLSSGSGSLNLINYSGI